MNDSFGADESYQSSYSKAHLLFQFDSSSLPNKGSTKKNQKSLNSFHDLKSQLGIIVNNPIRSDVISHCQIDDDILPMLNTNFDIQIESYIMEKGIEGQNWPMEEQIILIWMVSKFLDLRKVYDPSQNITLSSGDWNIIESIIPEKNIIPEQKWFYLKKNFEKENYRKKWHPMEALSLKALVEKQGANNWKYIAFKLYKLRVLGPGSTIRSWKQCEQYWSELTLKLNHKSQVNFLKSNNNQLSNPKPGQFSYISQNQEQNVHSSRKVHTLPITTSKIKKRGRPRKYPLKETHFSRQNPQVHESFTSQRYESDELSVNFEGRDMDWVVSEMQNSIIRFKEILSEVQALESVMTVKNNVYDSQMGLKIPNNNKSFVDNFKTQKFRNREGNGMNLYNLKNETETERMARQILESQKYDTKLPPLDPRRTYVRYLEDYIIQEEPSSSDDEEKIIRKAQEEDQSDFSGIFQ